VQLAVVVFATWSTMQTSNTALNPDTYQANNTFDALFSELPLLGAAVFGVGFLVRRSIKESLVRLAIVRPKVSHIVVAIVLAEVLVLLGVGADYLTHALTPGTAGRLESVSQALYSGYGSQWLPWVLLALEPAYARRPSFGARFSPALACH
jgi:hypothetical protein